jgi:hypothetical protein
VYFKLSLIFSHDGIINNAQVLESEAAKHKYAMGLSFEPEGPVVSTVGDNSLAMSKKIAVCVKH